MTDQSGPEDDGTDIAVIGLACRYPGACDPDAFWRNLVDGRETITRFPPRPIQGSGANGTAGEYVPARGMLEDPEWFDAGYFGYSPREARIISPQHRIFLECAVEALENAGHDPERHPGAIGVYAGGTETMYGHLVRSQRDRLPSVTDWEILLASATDYLVSRVSYKLGLRGPAVTVQAACATSLVAVHTAVQGLLSGDCDLALAGGIAVHAPAKHSPYTPGGIISREGTCRTFDSSAGGTVGADGAGIVVLRRLAEARSDGDRVIAVLRGSALNNDGAARVGYTAPSVDGQARVIRDAQLVAGIDAGTITYVEAHGTATPLGDPIEIAALTKAFRQDTERRGFCRIGSVKTNIGHTDAAAGVAGLIKTVLALDHGLVPPSLHFTAPNPQIDFAAGPFQVASRLHEWRPEGIPRRAGVSAFGIGGTNAHVVLEEAPPPPDSPTSRASSQLLVVSARTPTALNASVERLAAHLRDHPERPLADVAWTLQTGRREHAHRAFAVVHDTKDAVRALTDQRLERLVVSDGRLGSLPVAFLFPGFGGGAAAQRLQRSEPAFRAAVEDCREAAGDQWPRVLAFAEEYALARLWISWGVHPQVVLGTGSGALAAATIAGILSVPDAVRLLLAAEAAAASESLPRLVREIGPRTPRIPVVSEVNGRLIDSGEAADPAYWAAWAQATARPDRALSALLTQGEHILLEVGADRSLTSLARSRPEFTDGRLVIPVLSGDPGADAAVSVLSALGRMWLAGTAVSWAGVHGAERRRRVPLPTYPFERERYIVEPDGAFPGLGDMPPSRPDRREADGGHARTAGTAEGTGPLLARLFADILELPAVELEDGFFDLGGDSLIAAQLAAAVGEELQVHLEVEDLYDAQSPVELAALIDERLGDPRPSS